MSKLTFKVLEKWDGPRKVLTYDQIILDNGKTDNVIKKVVLTCDAGDVANLQVTYYRKKEDGTYDGNGETETYVVAAPEIEAMFSVMLTDRRMKEEKVE